MCVLSNQTQLNEAGIFLTRYLQNSVQDFCNMFISFQASITDLQMECSGAQLEIITTNFKKEWNDIAKLLGLDKNALSKIEESGKNPFGEIISNWKKKRDDSPFTYDTLITELSKSSEFTGKKEYVEQVILASCKLYSICSMVDLVIKI